MRKKGALYKQNVNHTWKRYSDVDWESLCRRELNDNDGMKKLIQSTRDCKLCEKVLISGAPHER